MNKYEEKVRFVLDNAVWKLTENTDGNGYYDEAKFEGLTSFEAAIIAAAAHQDCLHDFSEHHIYEELTIEERVMVSRKTPLPPRRMLALAAVVLCYGGRLPIPPKDTVQYYIDIVAALWRYNVDEEVPFLYHHEVVSADEWQPTDENYKFPKSERVIRPKRSPHRLRRRGVRVLLRHKVG